MSKFRRQLMINVLGAPTPPPPPPLPYDAEIEYLQSNSLAYIDTLINGNNNSLVISAKWSISTWVNSGSIYSNLSSVVGATSNLTRLVLSSTSGRIQGGINVKSANEVQVNNISLNTIYTTVAGRGYLEVNGNRTTKSAAISTANNSTIVIFNRAADSIVDRDLGMKLYFFKVTDNGTDVMDMIPVRIGQIGYLYDKVSDTLFGNDGTGSFTLGPDLNN